MGIATAWDGCGPGRRRSPRPPDAPDGLGRMIIASGPGRCQWSYRLTAPSSSRGRAGRWAEPEALRRRNGSRDGRPPGTGIGLHRGPEPAGDVPNHTVLDPDLRQIAGRGDFTPSHRGKAGRELNTSMVRVPDGSAERSRDSRLAGHSRPTIQFREIVPTRECLVPGAIVMPSFLLALDRTRATLERRRPRCRSRIQPTSPPRQPRVRGPRGVGRRYTSANPGREAIRARAIRAMERIGS